MKIAQIAPAWIPLPPRDYGGTEAMIYYLTERQVACGHEVTLLAPADAQTSAHLISFFPQSLVPAGVPWQAPLAALYHLHKSVEYIKRDGSFDIVHAHLSSPTDMVLLPLLASLSVPRVVTLHACFPLDFANSWIGKADSLYMDWSPVVPMVALSESARTKAPYGLHFIDVIYNGLLVDLFISADQHRSGFVVWLGRFVPEKGPHIAIEAAKQAGVPIVLAGTIDMHLKESKQYFQQIIEPQIDQEHVKYIGPVNLQQKVDLLSRAYAFLNPIQWEEPFGMVVIEAMVLGCPVISFTRGSAPELIQHAQTGFLAKNVDEMVDFIPKIKEIDRVEMQKHARSRFSAHTMYEKYIGVYQKIINTYSELPKSVPPTIRC